MMVPIPSPQPGSENSGWPPQDLLGAEGGISELQEMSSVTTTATSRPRRGSQSRVPAEQRQEPHSLVPTAPQGLEGQQSLARIAEETLG